MGKRKVIVAHPGKQHSYETALSMYKNDMLLKYITTVYDKPKSLTHFLNKYFLRGNDLKKSKSRRTDKIPNSIVTQKCELLSLIGLLILRIPKFINLYRAYSKLINKYFGILVAKYAIKHGADTIIMYDTTACSCFKYLEKHAPEIVRILDVSIATREYARIIYDEERRKTGSEDIYKENKYIWDNSTMKNYQHEIEKADYFLAASNFVKDSIIYLGVSEEKILKVPYGVDVSKFNIDKKKENSRNDDILKLIYVGQINSRKGIPHLLHTIDMYAMSWIDLTIVGGYDPNSKLYLQYKDFNNIHFVGYKVQNELIELYRNSDVFVLPSLCEGMALVGFEAMSMALPLVCSNNTGINDLITTYKNGIVFEAGNDNELYEALIWLKNNQEEIKQMGIEARKVVENYTWDDYHYRLSKIIQSIEGK